jgi:hypothetical protein
MHWIPWRPLWQPQPGGQVRAATDIRSPLGVAVSAGTAGVVIEVRRRRKVMIRFANGRTIEVRTSLLEPGGPFRSSGGEVRPPGVR